MRSSINQVFLLIGRFGTRLSRHICRFDLRPSCSGSTITAEIQGVIDACVKLTGMPDLTLSFMVSLLFLRARVGREGQRSVCLSVSQNPRLLDDVSFHPCVRFKRWEAERILSFIPPDGNFRLLSYHVSSQKLVRS